MDGNKATGGEGEYNFSPDISGLFALSTESFVTYMISLIKNSTICLSPRYL